MYLPARDIGRLTDAANAAPSVLSTTAPAVGSHVVGR